MTVGGALAAGTRQLAAAGIADPARDSRALMAAALGVPAMRVTVMAGEPIGAEQALRFEAMLVERSRARPVAQIVGERAFWGRHFVVTGDVLDPRPETEILVARALDGPAPARILDLGTGSGAILVSLLAEWPRAQGLGTDLSEPALAVATRNAVRHGVADRAAFRRADWGAGIEGGFDLVLSNPPYIPAAEVETLSRDVRDWEPREALTAGPTGLEAYARIAADLGRLLAPGGRALFEFGAGQGADAAALFRARGFERIAFHVDFDGRERVLAVA